MALTSARVKAQARALGFDAVGITSADPLRQAEARLRGWLHRGYDAGLWYLRRDAGRRTRPQALLPGARSVVALAVNYAPPADATPTGEPPSEARISAYAWGRDYHRVIERRLKALATWLIRYGGPGVRTRTYVDTGPVLERALAARAGLGFIGKNTTLIHPELGSWVFLAEVITTLGLDPDPPAEGDCGTCTACLDACPTGALTEPYQLDSNRCLSYLTIEHRGTIPREHRRALGAWVFGCDICQDVCPYNQQPVPADWEPRRAPGDGTLSLPLAGLLALADDDAFRRQFTGTALTRAKREGLVRNACVVAGNLRRRALIPALRARVINDPSPVVRGHAAWALGEMGGDAARGALKEALAREEHAEVRTEIEAALGPQVSSSSTGEGNSESPSRPPGFLSP